MDLFSSWAFYVSLSILPIIYWYFNQHFNYWKKKGVKGPKPIPVFGNLLDIFITPQPIQDCIWFKKYGRIYGYYFGKSPVLTIAEPELIKLVLVKDFHLFPERRHQKSLHPIISKNLVDATGDDWKRIRSIASPTFTSGKMKRMYPLIKQCLDDFIINLENYANNGKDIDIKYMYGNYTMDVIATCAFATKVNAHKEVDSPFIDNARKIFNFNVFRLIPFLVLPKYLLKYVKPGANEESTNFFLDSTRHIMDSRRKSNKKHNDFIQLLMDAERDRDRDVDRDDNDCNESHHINEGDEELAVEKNALNINLIDKHLTEDEILAQAFIFLLAGYETTATTLTYCSYELALNPEIQEKLYEEVNSAVNSKGEISYEELSRLPYLDSVISETLRLHPPALRVARISSTDYKLGDTGICIDKGVQIEVPIHAIHQSKEFYEDPHRFNPDRFMPENRHNIKPYTYLPFGAGPRNCIGMRFALLEAKLGLVHIIRKYRFLRSPKTEVPLKQRRVFRLNSPKSLIISIKNRQ